MTYILIMATGALAAAALAGCLLLFRRSRKVFQWADNEHRLLRNQLVDSTAEIAKLKALVDLQSQRSEGGALPRFASQFGEDAWLYEYFKDQIAAGDTGFYIEAGAHNGELLSNTLFLEDCGWTGLLVEADPKLAEQCKRARPNSQVQQVALGPAGSSGEVEFNCADLLGHVDGDAIHRERVANSDFDAEIVRVPQRSLNSLLEGLTEHVDILSLDLEGAELAALDGFDIDKYAPKVAIIEANNDEHANALKSWFAGKNYRLQATLAVNLFFVPNDSSDPSH